MAAGSGESARIMAGQDGERVGRLAKEPVWIRQLVHFYL